MRLIRGIMIGAAAVAAVGGAVALGGGRIGGLALHDFTHGARQSLAEAALNAALDASGAKSAIDAALRSQTPRIAEATGRSQEEVARAIDGLDIPSWGIVTLPAGAVEQHSVKTSHQGLDAVITTYVDPGYITLEAGGQRLTLSVPEGARDYVAHLGAL
ncbi:MAG: hypothetical protein ACLTOP_06595 [Collinsella phocaeensis]